MTIVKTTVTHTLFDPSESPVQRGGTITLGGIVDRQWRDVQGMTADGQVVTWKAADADETGSWSVDLIPNADVASPEHTLYRYVPAQGQPVVFEVTSGGPFALSTLVVTDPAQWPALAPTVVGPVGPAPTLTGGTGATLAPGAATVTHVTETAPGEYTVTVDAAAGTAATVAVDSTVTGDPGTSADVTNEGTSSAASFRFTIPRGASVLSGTGAPSSATGADTDFYIDITAHMIYGPKASGAWPAGVDLVGPQGDGLEYQWVGDQLEVRPEGSTGAWSPSPHLTGTPGTDGTGIASASVDGAGDLTLTLTDTTTLGPWHVAGRDGSPGEGVPDPASEADGRVLTVASGVAVWGAAPSSLPDGSEVGDSLRWDGAHWEVSAPRGVATTSVVGAAIVEVEDGWVYDVAASASPAMTLVAAVGSQVLVVWHGAAGAVMGVSVSDGDVLAAARFADSWLMVPVVGGTLVSTDVVPPIPGTLSVSDETSDGFTLLVSGASDVVGLAADPYRFSTDGGASWSAWQVAASFAATGLASSTTFTCVHEVRDAAGNTATGASIQAETSAPVVTLKSAITSLSPTLFAPLDDPVGTTTPVNLGSGGQVLSVSGSGVFGADGFAGGAASYRGGGTVRVASDPMGGATTCSAFIALFPSGDIGPAADLMGSPIGWRVITQSLSGGTTVGIGITFSDAVSMYANSNPSTLPDQVRTLGWSMSPEGGIKVYTNGAESWSGAATTMKPIPSGGAAVAGGSVSVLNYCSALWIGTALTPAQHLQLAVAAGVA